MNREFHDFERRGWADPAVVRAYEAGFGSLTVDAIDALLDAAAVRPGKRLLDVATGPGYVAATAAARGATVTAIDFAGGMIDEARRRYPGIDFRIGDALALGFDDGSFDAVTVNFGLLHFADPDLALTEALRVLKPGARLAATVWAAPERAAAFGFALDAVAAHGNPAVALPPGPPFFRLSDHAEFRRTLENAGFSHIDVGEHALTWRLPSADALIAAYEEGTARTGPLLRMQAPAQLEVIHEAIRAACEPYRTSTGAVVLPMPCVLASAARPGAAPG